MASSAQILCLLLCLHAFSLHIHAREYQFFNKLTPSTTTTNNNNNNNNKAKECDQNESPTMTPNVHNGYGLYGHDTDQEGAEFTSSNTPEKTFPEEHKGGENSEYTFNNGIPYNNNYESKQNSMNGNSYNNFRYPVKQQGMSDTRFLENGKYFYDVKNEELYKNRYHDIGVNSRNQYNTQGVDDNLYKFNNFMEDNQESQGEYVP